MMLVNLAMLMPANRLVRSPVPVCCAPGMDPKIALFSELLSSAPNAAVELAPASSDSGGVALVATQDVSAGDVLLTVPKKMLVTAHRSGVLSGLQGQTEATWDAAGDLRKEVGEEMFERGATWDVRLALGVFEACAGSGGIFWDKYRRLLPAPPKLAHPLTLPDAMLDELQDDEMADKTRQLREKLRALYPDLATHSVHPATAGYERMGAPMDQIPLPLPYAYALVVSRCFTMSDGDTFAFVPFLDMADHAAQPSANFASDARGFVLKSLRPIAMGEEVSICYGEEYTTRRLFEQYGFAPAEGTAADAQMLRDVVAAARADKSSGVALAFSEGPSTPLGQSQAALQALGAAFQELADSPWSTSERRGAIFDALTGQEEVPTTEGGTEGEEGEGGGGTPAIPAIDGLPPSALLMAVRWQLNQFPTSLEQDEALREQLTEQASGDVRPIAVINYRIARKRLLELTQSILSTFLGL